MSETARSAELLGWVRESRDSAARVALSESGLPASLSASLFEALQAHTSASDGATRELILLLRALRNLCAGVTAAQDQVLAAGAAEPLAQLCRHQAQLGDSAGRGELLEAALQALGNSCVQHERGQDAAWRAFFPDTFALLARTRGVGAALFHPPLCMLLFTCTQHRAERRHVLALQAPLLGSLLLASAEFRSDASTADGDGATNADEWLRLLLAELCCAGRLFDTLYLALADVDAPGGSLQQGLLLRALAEAVDGGCDLPAAECRGVVELGMLGADARVEKLVVDALERAALGCRLAPSDEAHRAVLEGALHLLRALAARDVHVEHEPEEAPRFVTLLLDLLASLGAPGGLRKRDEGERPAGPVRDAALNPPSQSSRYPSVPVYTGYRRDLVAALANASHRRERVVSAIATAGGVVTLLQQCRGDDEDTFMREWALWAVRNMCEISAEAQETIKEMEAQTIPSMD